MLNRVIKTKCPWCFFVHEQMRKWEHYVWAWLCCVFTDVISEWLTHLARSRLTIMRSMQHCMATGPTGATGTSTPGSTWPCSVRAKPLPYISHWKLKKRNLDLICFHSFVIQSTYCHIKCVKHIIFWMWTFFYFIVYAPILELIK